MRRTYKSLFWRATRPVNSTDCMIEGRYCLKRIIIDIFILCFKKYFHSFLQSAVFTERVARQNNGLHVLRMIVKLAFAPLCLHVSQPFPVLYFCKGLVKLFSFY